MLLKSRWLAIIGFILLAVGVYLAVTRQSWAYPGLVLVVGCTFIAVVLLIDEWSSGHPVPERDTDTSSSP